MRDTLYIFVLGILTGLIIIFFIGCCSTPKGNVDDDYSKEPDDPLVCVL